MIDRSPDEIQQRRERRAERRKNQRLTNLQRAAKMHAVRVLEEQVPKPAAPASRFLDGVHVGCSGWYYWHWKGRFYPIDVPSNQWFSIYEQNFKTVELNAPFYAWPTIATVKTWLRQANANFIYTIKVCELITHVKRFVDTGILIRDFGYIADLLGARMGCFLFQLPPSMRYDPTLLKSVLQQLDPRHRNVVEFRHKSWWNEDVYAAFRAAGAIFCSCSGPRLPDELVKTADDIYVRFHGTKQWYRHDYSDEELAIWVERIRKSGAKNIWVYFNNDRDGYAIKNAKALVELLSGNTEDMCT
ncbi:MAG TPA: DUF72 domain-containing protein [Edaphobacter sp.]|nr:DUF72 domain-containing protein [Edaphobacter sp.]